MQGAPWRLMGKPRMSCVRQFCPLFTRIVYTAVQPLSNCGRKFSETPGFFRIQILPDSISAGAPPRSPLGSLQCSPRPHSRLGRGTPPPDPHSPSASHRASPLFKTFRRPGDSRQALLGHGASRGPSSTAAARVLADNERESRVSSIGSVL